MQTTSNYLKQAIMRRVWTIWFVRRVLPWLALEAAALWFVLAKMAEQIFVNKVLQNAVAHTFSRSPFEFPSFFIHAFLNTETLVQTLIIALLTASILLARDLARTSSALIPRHRFLLNS